MRKYKPTTPTRRHAMAYDFSQLAKIEPLKQLTSGFHKSFGRNNKGRKTSGYRGRGGSAKAKRLYRFIDFRQDKFNVPGTIFALEYDPNRTSRIARVHYPDGEKRYILAPQEIKVGDIVITSEKTSLKVGNRMKLKNIPQGTMVHNVELRPGQGGKMVRSAGSGATVVANEAGIIHLQMPSSEVRIISGECYASIGQLSNQEHGVISLGKAGRTRWLGKGPKVRGTAMNPMDHPYGGGEGKQGRGTRRPKTATGKITGGRKSRRKNNRSNIFIVRRRIK